MGKYSASGPRFASSTEPYSVPSGGNTSGGFFRKLAGLFGAKSVPKSPSKVTSSTLSEFQPKEPQQQDFDVSTMSNGPRNPNDTLAEFFSSRGDKPLNDIEIEGVMSLIRKAHSESRNTSMINQSRSGIFGGNTSRITSGVSRNQSLLYNDSNNSTILRHSSSKVNIPTPKFVPPKSANTSMTHVDKSTLGNIIKKRRMVSYNNLDQQKYKISSPLANYIEKRKRENRQRDQQRSNLAQLEESASETAQRQTLSKTANTVLDILESNSETKSAFESAAKIDEKPVEKSKSNSIEVVSPPKTVAKNIGVPKAEKSESENNAGVAVENDSDIIIIEDSDEDMEDETEKKSVNEKAKEEDNEKENPKESSEIQKTDAIKPFAFEPKQQTSKLPSVPAFTFSAKATKPVEKSNDKTGETAAFPFKPMAELFPNMTKETPTPVKEQSKTGPVETEKLSEQQKPAFSFTPSMPKFTKPDSTDKFTFNTDAKPVLADSETVVDIGAETQADEDKNSKEIIDHFDFPDVSDTNIEVTVQDCPVENGKNGNVYHFPSVDPPNKELLGKIDERVVELYNNSFKF